MWPSIVKDCLRRDVLQVDACAGGWHISLCGIESLVGLLICKFAGATKKQSV